MSQWMTLSYVTAIALMIVILGTALLVLWKIFTNTIDLSTVLQEPDSSKASLSRFQFLLFTFVVAGLFLMLSIESGAFVTIPEGVLSLLGISATSYAVSKGITANAKGTNDAKARAANSSAAAHAAQASAAASAAAAHAADAQNAADSAKKPT